ncbi:hypothetical protein RB195_020831 [Necator americanus]|uniref:Sulfur globule protein CV3 domain protein n=1 Tax=Necator americanus TaxID=51031 RepID=A0ABR1CKQ9_NECAM
MKNSVGRQPRPGQLEAHACTRHPCSCAASSCTVIELHMRFSHIIVLLLSVMVATALEQQLLLIRPKRQFGWGGGYRPYYGGGFRPPYGGGFRPPYGGGFRPPYGGGFRPPIDIGQVPMPLSG